LAVVYQIAVGNHIYNVVDDLTTIHRVLITGLVRDELTGEPLRTRFVVRVGRTGLYIKTLDGSLFCIAGFPEQVIPSLDVVIAANGYQELARTVSIAPNATFPVSMPSAQLRRLPIRIQGRVSEEAGPHAAIPGAKILSVDAPGPPPTEHVVVLRAPVHFNHASGVSVQGRMLNPVPFSSPPKRLEADAHAGDRTLIINNRQGLMAPHILRFDSEMWGTYGEVESVAQVPANLTLAGEVTLRSAITRSFRATTALQVFTRGSAVGPPRHLTQEANAGDGTLILDGVLTADTVEIADLPQPSEYHDLGALTDTAGYYQLNDIGRVRTIYLAVSVAGFTSPPPVPWVINYEQPVNLVDFRLRP
jgi:hypothetical protein